MFLWTPESPVILNTEELPYIGISESDHQKRAERVGVLLVAASHRTQSIEFSNIISTEDIENTKHPTVMPLPFIGRIAMLPGQGALFVPNGEGRLGDISADDGSIHGHPGVSVKPSGDCDSLVILQPLAETRGYAATFAISHVEDPGQEFTDRYVVRFGVY